MTPEDLLETVTDTASGRILTFSYNAEGLIAALIGPVTDSVADGVWARFDYDDRFEPDQRYLCRRIRF